MSQLARSRVLKQLLNRSTWLLAIVSLLWLSMIAPAATMVALLAGSEFHSFWIISLLFLPVVLALLMLVFRTWVRTFRMLFFQYLGISSVCFSAAVCGVILSFFISNSAAGVCSVVLAALFCAWAMYSAHRIHAVTLHVTDPKIGRALRVVQISDVHMGSRKPAFLQKVIARVQLHDPDMLVITGDLVDEDVSPDDLAPLASLSCPVLYCSGNHERYIDYADVLKHLVSHGVTVLNDRVVELHGLRVIGVEDQTHRATAIAILNRLCASDAGAVASDRGTLKKPSPFTVLLYHQPDIWDAARNLGIELMLSGHTHNGQIWPFGWLVRTRYAHLAGHFTASPSHLFVSQGTGTWGPLMRFGTRCEMTVIELRSEACRP